MWKPNEEFCHIIVDTGIFDHHLPDSVQGAVECLYQHQIVGKDIPPDLDFKKHNIPLEQRQAVRSTPDTDSSSQKTPLKKNKTPEVGNTSEVDVKGVDTDKNTVEVIIHKLPKWEN